MTHSQQTVKPFAPLGRVLITGASSGIGEASAIAFAKAGFDVALVARSHQKLAVLTQLLSAFGVKAESFVIDLADLDQVKLNIAKAVDSFGPIDVLLNSAGIGYTGSLNTMPLANWQQVMGLNVTSVFQVVQAVLPGMRQRARGMIINISSIAASQAFPNWGAYGVSKAALEALSEAISAEESAHGIRVVTLSPGAVNTPLWDTATVQADFNRSMMLSPETVAKTIVHAALLPPEAVISKLTLTPAQGAL